ncbi:MAG: pilus assembly protein N-terminal domain-containing protein, partial [Bradymonadaceae bacterium]
MTRSRVVLWWLSVVAVAVTTLSVMPDAAHAQAPDREFTIAVGETLTFNARSVRRVTVGLSDVADVKRTEDGRQLILVGKSRGVTTINIYSRDDQRTLLVRVVGVNPTSLAQECRAILGDGSGVDVRVVKGRVLLEGEVASKTFKKKIKKLT